MRAVAEVTALHSTYVKFPNINFIEDVVELCDASELTGLWKNNKKKAI